MPTLSVVPDDSTAAPDAGGADEAMDMVPAGESVYATSVDISWYLAPEPPPEMVKDADVRRLRETWIHTAVAPPPGVSLTCPMCHHHSRRGGCGSYLRS